MDRIYETISKFIEMIKHHILNKNDMIDYYLDVYLSNMNTILELISFLDNIIKNNQLYKFATETKTDKEFLEKLNHCKNKVERIYIASASLKYLNSHSNINYQFNNSLRLLNILTDNHFVRITYDTIHEQIQNEATYPTSFQYYLINYCFEAEKNYNLISPEKQKKIFMNFPLLKNSYSNIFPAHFNSYLYICNLIFNLDKVNSEKFDKDNSKHDAKVNYEKKLLEAFSFFLSTKHNLALICPNGKEINYTKSLFDTLSSHKYFNIKETLICLLQNNVNIPLEIILVSKIENNLLIDAIKILRSSISLDLATRKELYFDLFKNLGNHFQEVFKYLNEIEKEFLFDYYKQSNIQSKGKILALFDKHTDSKVFKSIICSKG